MEFKEVVSTRRSVRKFSEREVSREVINELMEVVSKAPSSRNSHSTHFMVVTNAELLTKISTMRDYGAAFIKGAPAAIIVMGDRAKSDLVEVNASISTTVLQLAITNMGLSSCWVHVAGRAQKQSEPEGAVAEELLRQLLPIPEQSDVLCVVALGYSDFHPAPLPEYRADVVYVE